MKSFFLFCCIDKVMRLHQAASSMVGEVVHCNIRWYMFVSALWCQKNCTLPRPSRTQTYSWRLKRTETKYFENVLMTPTCSGMPEYQHAALPATCVMWLTAAPQLLLIYFIAEQHPRCAFTPPNCLWSFNEVLNHKLAPKSFLKPVVGMNVFN